MSEATTPDEPGFRRAARVLVSVRVRQGRARVRTSFVPTLQAAVAAGLSWALAYYALGHEFPFFAPVCAWVALGFSADRQVRRVAELAVGVAIGVGLGDLVVHVIGSGPWQIALVLLVSAMLARFIDRGPVLTTQAGVQAIGIVGLPALAASGSSPVGRWTDALVGGVVALGVAALSPDDPRRRPRAQARQAVLELAGMLDVLGRGLRTGSAHHVEDALIRGRASQPALDDWREGAANARNLARVSPAGRRHRDELGALGASAVYVDRAMRNARVLARRALSAVEGDHERDLGGVAAAVDSLARAAGSLAGNLGTGAGAEATRRELLAVAQRLDPFRLAPDDWQVQSLVLLVRSLTVDLLEASGVPEGEAREALPEI
ncbi:FUSC family protein [Cellulomonas cellasea]|uniref:FUSC family protein n=1 Tax=Cellulomonas cellasea TaxID=43670 RepID=A0A4Y3KRK7_9CELL|nr:FUSC family protein [Cellulomonas cellasea]GEA86577.1 FUSC family protein [Cellulomonas cellasea]